MELREKCHLALSYSVLQEGVVKQNYNGTWDPNK